MRLSLSQRTLTLGVGEFSDFQIGPRSDSSGGHTGLWRAQLGQHWHSELRQREASTVGASFEVPLEGCLSHRGWKILLAGRIDQRIDTAEQTTIREIKTVTRALPIDPATLRAEYPSYFIQLAVYIALARAAATTKEKLFSGELVFVEAATGTIQTIAHESRFDDALLVRQLDILAEFAEQRRERHQRRLNAPLRPAFATLREGQENIQRDIAILLSETPDQVQEISPSNILCFEAPTGFGKTGCLLEYALSALRDGRYERVVYLTGKSTGQIQIIKQLEEMIAAAPGESASGFSYWRLRPKSEHCVNTVFHCRSDSCQFLADAETRWSSSGLSRFFLIDQHPRDIDSLREAGCEARICPYEITRAALPFCDVWIGDYNYVFAPGARSFFYEQPSFDPSQTLLIVDEAHNLASRVADAHSYSLEAGAVCDVLEKLRELAAPAEFLQSWENWAALLQRTKSCDAINADDEDQIRSAVGEIAAQITTVSIDQSQLTPAQLDIFWQLPALAEFLQEASIPKLVWSPTDGVLRVTCLDASALIGATLRSFRHSILVSATLGPAEIFHATCGLEEHDSSEKILTETNTAKTQPTWLRAHAPWRSGAYNVAVDCRVDTRFEHRDRHLETTCATLAAMGKAAGTGCAAAFFPSYAYAERVVSFLRATQPQLHIALQPRGATLGELTDFLEKFLRSQGIVCLVLGTGTAEGIDLLGGKVSHAMVAGPALPEVNAVQRARLAAAKTRGAATAFRQIYDAPGMNKVNQAIGRLVRGPGQRTRVLLHCQRFAAEPYRSLLHKDFAARVRIDDETDLAAWLAES